MNVFISYSHRDKELALRLSKKLEVSKFYVFIDNKIPVGGDIYREIGRQLYKTDAVVVIVSKNTFDTFGVKNETMTMLSFLDKGRMPLVIPVVVGEDVEIPYYLSDYNCLKVASKDKFEEAIEQIVALLKFHEQKLEEINAEKIEAEKKVKESLSEYISDVFDILKLSERTNKVLAYIMYIFSTFTLIFSAGLSLYLNNGDYTEVFTSVTSSFSNFVVLALLVALSRLFYILGKSFMVESIRKADRIHAISFGKFFLDAFGEEASREEIIKAFSSWNIDGGSSFRTQSTEDIDPKFNDISSLVN